MIHCLPRASVVMLHARPVLELHQNIFQRKSIPSPIILARIKYRMFQSKWTQEWGSFEFVSALLRSQKRGNNSPSPESNLIRKPCRIDWSWTLMSSFLCRWFFKTVYQSNDEKLGRVPSSALLSSRAGWVVCQTFIGRYVYIRSTAHRSILGQV